MLDPLSTQNWRLLISATARKAPCIECGLVAGWHPKNWLYRHIPQRGGKRNEPKVKTERLCPTCSVKMLGEEHVRDLRGLSDGTERGKGD